MSTEGRRSPPHYEHAFVAEEAAFVTPPGHELFNVTLRLIAPTVATFGTGEQQRRWVGSFLRTEDLCCQLFSEPGAGSDLAGVATRAVRDGDDWVLTGQKVWSSGAQFARWGQTVCRTDPDAPKHDGLTVFLVPMDAHGVTVRPIRQMTGGGSFNEVFLDEVRIPDALRLGEVNEGWRVTLTTLAFERAAAAYQTHDRIGGSWPQVLALARWSALCTDPLVRQRLAQLFILGRIREFTVLRSTAGACAGGQPGPAGSVGKLQWTRWMTEMSEAVTTLLGPRLVADTGEWGTFAWAAHVLGAPGYRIAGGSDEIQRTILGERVLDLPREPRPDRAVPFHDAPR